MPLAGALPESPSTMQWKCQHACEASWGYDGAAPTLRGWELLWLDLREEVSI